MTSKRIYEYNLRKCFVRAVNKNNYLILFGLIFLAPRVVRILYPYVWLEDPFYLYAASLIRQGAIPFHDFGHTQLPGAEFLLAFFYGFFGDSYVVAEVISQVVIYLNTWLIFFIGGNICNKTVGFLSALIFSCSSLLFRYHVWEREVLLVFLLTVTFYLLLGWPKLNLKRTIILSLILTAGVFCKLTMVVSAVPVFFFIFGVRKERFNAILLAILTFSFCVLALLLLFLKNPANVFNQAFLYHFVKGVTHTSVIEKLLYPLYVLDIPLALGVSGVFFWKKEMFPAFWFPIFLVLFDWMFFSFISPNVWPHNYIPSLLLFSLSGGVFIFSVWESFWIKQKVIGPCLSIVFFFFLLACICPIKNLNWAKGGFYGFGYIPRKEINEVGRFIRSNTTEDDLLLIPQYIASEAGRRSVISDRIEAIGVFRWIEERKKEGYTTTQMIAMCRSKSFEQMQKETLLTGWESVRTLLKQKKIKFFVPDIVPGEQMPFVSKDLADMGYMPLIKIGLYVVWTPWEKRDDSFGYRAQDVKAQVGSAPYHTDQSDSATKTASGPDATSQIVRPSAGGR